MKNVTYHAGFFYSCLTIMALRTFIVSVSYCDSETSLRSKLELVLLICVIS